MASAITGYVVTPYIAGVAQATQTFNSTATTETATGLTNGTAYTFTVAAINSVGTGTASAESASATPATTAGAPTIGTATIAGGRLGHGHLDGSGQQRRLGHHRLRGHPLHRRRGPGHPELRLDGHHRDGRSVWPTTPPTPSPWPPVNGMGTGSNSAQSNSVTTPTTPGAPTIGDRHIGNASVSLSWTAPANNGGNAITGYVVTPYIAGVAQATQTFNSTATTETVTGLTNGTAYTFKVAAINGVGTGTQSAASASVTPATTPGRRPA